MTAYENLKNRFARCHHLDEASGLLGWDFQTMMPDGAGRARGETLASLAGLKHQLLSAPEVGDWLAEAEGSAPSDPWDKANLSEMRRLYTHATAVPGDLVEASSKAATEGEMAWRQARQDDDFSRLQPHLEGLIDLQRQTATAKAEALGVSPYDALLDQFEPGGRIERIETLFETLAAELPSLTDVVLERQAKIGPPAKPKGPFPIPQQKALGQRLMGAVGFDFERGRLDISHHPFCGGAFSDVRITTRYDEDDFTSALMGVLHETGHALYEQNRPASWSSQPVGSARGMTLHESQSLLVEMQVCRGRDFLSFAVPLMREAFGKTAGTDVSGWADEDLQRQARWVERGCIRVDADEVTYPGHVILRTRLERAMLSGDLAVADLPGAWSEGMVELVGIRPPDDRLGCLQDIHWPSGAFGYFPTYTLGALAAAQLFQAAVDAVPVIPERLRRGDFSPLMGWLKENIHGRASGAGTEEILRDATGSGLGTDPFLAHLRRRYLSDAEEA